MAFNRDQVITHAKKFWNRLCDDDRVGLPSEIKNLGQKRRALIAAANAKSPGDWDIFYVPNGQGGENAVFGRFDGSNIVDRDPDFILTDQKDHLNDCTHYVSRCLLAGGAAIKETGRADELIRALIKSADTRVFVTQVSKENGQKIVDAGLMKPGDVVGYAKISNGNYHHTAVFVGPDHSTGKVDGGIACHSNCRFGGLTIKVNPDSAGDDSWFINDQAGTYTLIHFVDNGKPLSIGPLQGWWQRANGSFTFIDHGGIAYSTKAKPKKASDRPTAKNHHARSHEADGGIAFVWTTPLHQIEVETWKPGMQGGSTVQVFIDGAPELATRMFP